MYLTHNEKLGVMAGLTFFAGVLSLLYIDSTSPIPSVVLALAIGWWLLFGYANNWFKHIGEKNTDNNCDTATQGQREIMEYEDK